MIFGMKRVFSAENIKAGQEAAFTWTS